MIILLMKIKFHNQKYDMITIEKVFHFLKVVSQDKKSTNTYLNVLNLHRESHSGVARTLMTYSVSTDPKAAKDL